MRGACVPMIRSKVERSGSGNSTIIELIERFHDPSQGEILINGKNIKSMNLESLLSHVGLVRQKPTLFAGTLLQNIACGRENATKEEIIEASRVANVHLLVSALPMGYDSCVGERGCVQLSHGHTQGIAIARAVLKNPAILVLEEATVSDYLNHSEHDIHLVQDALDRMMIGRTTIVVSHRISTILNAETIAALELGAMFASRPLIVDSTFRREKSKGKQLATTSESPAHSSVHHSVRADRLMQMRSEFPTDLEFAIESSKDHWSELTPVTSEAEVDSLIKEGDGRITSTISKESLVGLYSRVHDVDQRFSTFLVFDGDIFFCIMDRTVLRWGGRLQKEHRPKSTKHFPYLVMTSSTIIMYTKCSSRECPCESL